VDDGVEHKARVGGADGSEHGLYARGGERSSEQHLKASLRSGTGSKTRDAPHGPRKGLSATICNPSESSQLLYGAVTARALPGDLTDAPVAALTLVENAGPITIAVTSEFHFVPLWVVYVGKVGVGAISGTTKNHATRSHDPRVRSCP
jgi:hypothetical protein